MHLYNGRKLRQLQTMSDGMWSAFSNRVASLMICTLLSFSDIVLFMTEYRQYILSAQSQHRYHICTVAATARAMRLKRNKSACNAQIRRGTHVDTCLYRFVYHVHCALLSDFLPRHLFTQLAELSSTASTCCHAPLRGQ